MKKIITLITIFIFCTMLWACTSSNIDTAETIGMTKNLAVEATMAQPAQIEIKDYPISHDINSSSGGVHVEIPIEDFNALGFAFGDSVDVKFSNGYELKALPYYNDYYVYVGDPVVVGKSDHKYVKVALRHSDDLYEVADLSENDTATITLNQKEKYIKKQLAMDIEYTNDREDYASDVVFANFRGVSCGNLKENILYRSASPCDNQCGRAPYANSLVENVGVKFVMNLSDSEESIEYSAQKDDFDSPYYLSLYKEGNVIPLSMMVNYHQEKFAPKVVKGLTAISEHDGPYLIHCIEGKDRTGFVCMLVEALTGATYQEMVDDYMITYDNYFGINKESDPVRYDAIKEVNIDTMLRYISGADETADLTEIDYRDSAKKYLLNAGMTETALNHLYEKLCD